MSSLTYVGPMSRWEAVVWVTVMTTITVLAILVAWVGLMWGMCRLVFGEIRDKRSMWALFKSHPLKLPGSMISGFILSSLTTVFTGSFVISLLTADYGIFDAIYLVVFVAMKSYMLVGFIGRIYLGLYDNKPDYLTV